MVELIFDESGNFVGYSETGYSASEKEEVKQVSESDLSKMVSDRNKDWKELVSGFYLESGTVEFDSSYSPNQGEV